MMKERIRRAWRGLVVDLLLVSGAMVVSVGVGLIYFPAGLITAGVLTMVGAKLAAAGERGGSG